MSTNDKPAYEIKEENWYRSLPYGFHFKNRNAKGDDFDLNSKTFYLPILPSNLNVTTHFATNIVTTLFGVVEEHSEIRYYDIEIAGTTGIAPRWVEARQHGDSVKGVISPGRTSEDVAPVTLGGFLPEVTNTLNQIKKLASDPTAPPDYKTGVNVKKTGYIAFHNFYLFLLAYKKDAAGLSSLGNKARSHHPLSFLNYKDGLKYDVAIQSFTLTRSAENPMLYNYSIKMRGYNLRSVNRKEASQNQKDKLGLGDIKGQSLFSSITSVVGNAATLLGGIL